MIDISGAIFFVCIFSFIAFLLGIVAGFVIFSFLTDRLGREQSERSAGIADPDTGTV